VADSDAIDAVLDGRARIARTVLNLAAYTRVDAAEADPEAAFRTNATAVGLLADACRRSGKLLVHVSTDHVFDGEAPESYTEMDPVHPLNAYGRSKVAGEEVLRRTLPRHIIVRTSWVFGTGHDNFVTTMLRLARERDEVRVVASEVGCPTPAEELASALLVLAEHIDRRGFDAWGTYHYCGRPAVSRADWARWIFERVGQVGDLRVARVIDIASRDFPTPALRPARVILDCSAIERTFGIEQPAWEPALDRMLRESCAGPRPTARES
jgi:dTDP-4-dehydrorhamnose reductase